MMKASVMTGDLRKLNVVNKSERGEGRKLYSMYNAPGRHQVPRVTHWVAQSPWKQESTQLTIPRGRGQAFGMLYTTENEEVSKRECLFKELRGPSPVVTKEVLLRQDFSLPHLLAEPQFRKTMHQRNLRNRQSHLPRGPYPWDTGPVKS